jgi:hypothetical protein
MNQRSDYAQRLRDEDNAEQSRRRSVLLADCDHRDEAGNVFRQEDLPGYGCSPEGFEE